MRDVDLTAIEAAHTCGVGRRGASDPLAWDFLVAWAESTRRSLEDLQRRREAHIQAMYDQLEGLWRRLGVPDEAMDGFVDAHRGCTEETVREYEAELERMLELKRERMSAVAWT